MSLAHVVDQLKSMDPRTIAAGDLSQFELAFRVGMASGLGTANNIISDQGGAPFDNLPSAAEQLKLVSDDVADAAAGAGAREVRLIGLDGNYEILSEDVTLDGTNVVTTTGSFLRVISLAVIVTGDDPSSNKGNIQIKNNAATIVLGQITQFQNNYMSMQYTVPAGQTLFVAKIWVSHGQTDVYSFTHSRRAIDGTFLQQHISAYCNAGVSVLPLSYPLQYSEKEDLICMGSFAGGAANAISGGFHGVLITN